MAYLRKHTSLDRCVCMISIVVCLLVCVCGDAFFLLLQHSYRLWIPQRKVFEPNQGRFVREDMDSYNWNYLDQHICRDPEFDELIEVI